MSVKPDIWVFVGRIWGPSGPNPGPEEKLVENMSDIFAKKVDKTGQDAEKEEAQLFR